VRSLTTGRAMTAACVDPRSTSFPTSPESGCAAFAPAAKQSQPAWPNIYRLCVVSKGRLAAYNRLACREKPMHMQSENGRSRIVRGTLRVVPAMYSSPFSARNRRLNRDQRSSLQRPAMGQAYSANSGGERGQRRSLFRGARARRRDLPATSFFVQVVFGSPSASRSNDRAVTARVRKRCTGNMLACYRRLKVALPN